MLSIDILESEKELQLLIMNAFIEEVNPLFEKKKSAIKRSIQEIIIAGLQETQEYSELTTGILKIEFGFMFGSERDIIDPIIEKIAQNIELIFTQLEYKNGSVVGGFQVNMLQADFSDIFAMPEAITEPQGYGFESIPWLYWYLTKGGQAVIANYGILYGEFPENSRSGYAVMLQDFGPYIVPGDNSERDNWLTRFFSSPTFQNAIQLVLSEVIQGS